MYIPKIIIAIDGYSSTGKSSFAKLIAERYSFLYLDSGALYRAVSLFALEESYYIDAKNIDKEGLEAALPSLDLNFKYEGSKPICYIGDRCVEQEIRGLRVSKAVSPISTLAFVRNFVDTRLRNFAKNKAVVMDGRDIGTTVFPEAELKIFMLAMDSIRAKRRLEEMQAKGLEANYTQVLKNLQERDYIDSNRLVSPLRQAEDAIILDNSYLSMEDQFVWLEAVIRNKFADEAKG